MDDKVVFVESGYLKGKKIILPPLNTTRSTKSIVKSCVFNVLRYDLKDKIFIEAFGGSGSMAIEALSNYANCSIIIEKDKNAYKIIEKNIKNLNIKAFYGDTFELLPNIIKKLEKNIILYLDPPFDIRNGFMNIYENIYKLIDNLKNDLLDQIIIEYNSKNKMPNILNNFINTKTKKFGNTSLAFYKNKDMMK